MSRNNNFDLTLDTLAPVGSITRPAQYLRVNDDLVIVKGDATYMKVWFDAKASGDANDAPANPIAAATSFTTEFSQNGTFYYHLILIDDVNNASQVYNTSEIVFDNVAPVIDEEKCYLEDLDSGSTALTNSRTIKYHIEYSDASPSSGIASIVISGNCLNAPVNVTPAGSGEEGQFSFKDSETDGVKTVTITVTDNAGNTDSYDVSIKLDMSVATPVLTLLKVDGTTLLPAYVNSEGIKARLTSTDTDIVEYKIWEGNNEPSTWQSVSTLDVALSEINSLTLSSGDGLKTINAKVKDAAGTVKAADAQTVTLDKTAPSGVEITSTGNIISTVSGYDAVTLTLAGSDLNPGVTYKLVQGTQASDTLVDSGNSLPANFVLSKTSGAMVGDGTYTYTLFVEDAAGNVTSDDINVILDTTAPTMSLGDISGWHNAGFPVTLTYADANNVVDLYIWKDNAAGTVIPVGLATTPTGSPMSIPSSSISGTFSQGQNYLHVKLVDEVGNVSFLHQAFTYDDVQPVVASVNFSRATYQTTAASIRIGASDATSGLAYMQISGDIQNPTEANQWEVWSSTRSVVLTNGDGNKTVSVLVKDNAGNISAAAGQATCELDTKIPYANLILRKANDSDNLPARVNNPEFAARISGYDDDTAVEYTVGSAYAVGDLIKHGNIVYKIIVAVSAVENTQWSDLAAKVQISGAPVFYLIYGDCTYDAQGAQGLAYKDVSLYAEETAYALNDLIFYEGVIYKVTTAISAQDNTGIDAVTKSVDDYWQPYSVDAGVNYKLIEDLYCTSGDGTKTINLRTIDNAGRVSNVASQTFVYDTLPPVVTITTNPDYNRISKVHLLRRSSATTEINGKFADEIHFTFTPNENIQAYKVCAYLDSADAVKEYPTSGTEAQQAWLEAQVAIPNTAGSTNVSATGLDSEAAVDVMIKGADYETALVVRGAVAGSTAEGGHLVVIYIKDANLWSAIASFES